MASLGIVLWDSGYISSWLNTGVVHRLAEDHHIVIIYNAKKVKKLELEKFLASSRNISIVPIKLRFSPLMSFGLKTQMIRNINLSRSFKYRLAREKEGYVKRPAKQSSILRAILWWWKPRIYNVIRFPFKTILNSFLGPFLRYPPVQVLVLKLFDFESRLLAKRVTPFLARLDLNYMVLPSSNNEIYLPVFILAAKVNGIYSIFVPNNWDNLSSKTVLRQTSDFVTVLGPQTSLHAQFIQGFSLHQIVYAGLPKFENYFPNTFAPKRYKDGERLEIGYMGVSAHHQESNYIETLCKLLESDTHFPNFNIKYRPHPFRAKRFSELDFNGLNERVHIHERTSPLETIRENLHGLRNGSQISTSNVMGNEYYDPTSEIVDFAKSVHIVLCTPTTAILEMLLLKVPTILEVHDDSVHLNTSRLVVEQNEHLIDLFQIKNLKIAYNVIDARNLLQYFVKEYNSFETSLDFHYLNSMSKRFSSSLSQFISFRHQ